MKLIGNLLLTICLITGCLSAATAYLAPADATGLTELTLSEPAGATPASAEAVREAKAAYDAGAITAETYIARVEALEPVVDTPADDAGEDERSLSEAQLDAAREAKVEHLHLKEFSLARWPHAWIFGLSAAGLFAGSLLVRAGDKAIIAKQHTGDADTPPVGSPEVAMKAIQDGVLSLQADLASMPSADDKLRAILARLGDLQGDAIPTFIEARAQLIAKFGLGRYAEIMDRFAAMERKINRSWSAAADGHLGESSTALDDAALIAPDVSAKL